MFEELCSENMGNLHCSCKERVLERAQSAVRIHSYAVLARIYKIEILGSCHEPYVVQGESWNAHD
jgi:hypothetical protein